MQKIYIIDVGLLALKLEADFTKERVNMNDVKSLPKKLKFGKYLTI